MKKYRDTLKYLVHKGKQDSYKKISKQERAALCYNYHYETYTGVNKDFIENLKIIDKEHTKAFKEYKKDFEKYREVMLLELRYLKDSNKEEDKEKYITEQKELEKFQAEYNKNEKEYLERKSF